MKKVLITAYAVNPYKGSEDAMGWQMILQALRYQHVIAVTRKNNREAIEKYIVEHPEMKDMFARLSFLYFDWPQWMIFWKKGPLLSMIYYYGWQFTLAVWLKRRCKNVDVVHNLNFHNDWSPGFLWMLKKPMVWGQVGHHSKIPRNYILPVYGFRAYLKDRFLWMIKLMAWNFDPFLFLSKKKANMIICMNREAVKKLRLKNNFLVHPSVAAKETENQSNPGDTFKVISVGRFVPLKGFDLTIRSFALFYRNLNPSDQQKARLILIGKGPEKDRLQTIAKQEAVSHVVDFVEWMPHADVIKLYQSASVFLFPSHEGAGMVVPEAMSAGIPVVCLNNSGPGEFVHPESALSVSYSSYSMTIDELALRLTKLFFIKDFYEKEKSLTRIRYNDLFRWDVRGEMLKEVYNNVCQ